MPRLQGYIEGGEFIRQPGYRHRRVPQNARCYAGLLDISVAVKNAAHPAHIYILRAHRVAAEDKRRCRAVVSHGVANLARILHSSVDDFDGGDDVLGGADYVRQADRRTL